MDWPNDADSAESSATEAGGLHEFDPSLQMHDARDPIEHVSLAIGSKDGLEGGASRLTEEHRLLLEKLASDPGGVKAKAETALRFWQERKQV